MNKVFLYGHLGDDPKVSSLASGRSVTRFSVATVEKYTDKSGEHKAETTWHKVVVWGLQGENCEKFLRKGDPVIIEGQIANRSYEDEQRQKRYLSEVKALQVRFLKRAEKQKDVLPQEDYIPF